VHRADFEVPGDIDIVAKMSADLAQAGHHLDAAAVRERLAQYQTQA